MLRFFQENIGILAAAQLAHQCAEVTQSADLSLGHNAQAEDAGINMPPLPSGLELK